MKRSENRILTTHVGSLIRPADLLQLSIARGRGETIDEAAYEALLRREVAAVVKRQVETGVDIVNDGEFGKSSWAAYILERLSGFEIQRDRAQPLNWLGRDRERFKEFFEKEMPNAITGGPAEVCVGPIEYKDTESIQRDLGNLQAAADVASPNEVFFTTVAPASTAYNGINEYYPSDKEYAYAIADALRQEYQAIYKAGFVVQVDDAVLANMYDHLIEKDPAEYQSWAGNRIDALNHALQGIPMESIRYHVCYGSWHVPHVADAPLEDLLPLILRVNAGAISIEAANARHEHEWELWDRSMLRPGQSLIPGVVSHHTVTVEHPRLVAQRIERFADRIGAENVIAGTDCGFAQSQGVQRVHPSIMWAKLEALVEGAKLASDKLFR